jgi:HPt (histidine-containing phosphotransfer) domain-containing protein
MRPGIDPDVLKRLLGDDPELARDVVEDFLPAAQAAIAEIRAAVDDRLPEHVKGASHKLKGSASLVGAHRLIDVCAEIESAAEEGNWDEMHRLSAGLDEIMADIERSAAAFLRPAAG